MAGGRPICRPDAQPEVMSLQDDATSARKHGGVAPDELMYGPVHL